MNLPIFNSGRGLTVQWVR